MGIQGENDLCLRFRLVAFRFYLQQLLKLLYLFRQVSDRKGDAFAAGDPIDLLHVLLRAEDVRQHRSHQKWQVLIGRKKQLPTHADLVRTKAIERFWLRNLEFCAPKSFPFLREIGRAETIVNQARLFSKGPSKASDVPSFGRFCPKLEQADSPPKAKKTNLELGSKGE